jgi:hypothetical protein
MALFATIVVVLMTILVATDGVDSKDQDDSMSE